MLVCLIVHYVVKCISAEKAEGVGDRSKEGTLHGDVA